MVDQARSQNAAIIALSAFERFVARMRFDMVLEPAAGRTGMLAALESALVGALHRVTAHVSVETALEGRCKYTLLAFVDFRIWVDTRNV